MFGKFFGPKRGGGNEGIGNGGSMGEFDSQELQEAINEISEVQGQSTAELDAAMNGWEELAAMGRENGGTEAWSEGAMSADEAMGQSLQEAIAGATVYEDGLGATTEEEAVMEDAEVPAVEGAGVTDGLSPRERLARAAAEARPGAWMSDEEKEEMRREEQAELQKQREQVEQQAEQQAEQQRRREYYANLERAAAEARPGAWMSDEEKAEQEAAKEALKGKKGIFGWMNEMKKSMQELWHSLTTKGEKSETEIEAESEPVPEMYNTENLVQDFFERNFQGMDEKAKALREDIAEKATLSRIAGAREAARRRAELEGRALTADFEQQLENEAAFDTRHILEGYYLNGGRLGQDINGEELSEEEQIAWKLASEPHKHGQLNLTHLFNEYPRREAETPDDYEARLKGYAKQDLQRAAQLKADSLVKWEDETPEEFEERWKKAVEMRKGEDETETQFEARWQREVVWTKEMRTLVNYQEEMERRLEKMTDPEMRAKFEAVIKQIDDRLDAIAAAERKKAGEDEEGEMTTAEKNAEFLGAVDEALEKPTIEKDPRFLNVVDEVLGEQKAA